LPVTAGQERLGFVVTLGKDKSLNQLEQIAMEQAGTVIALELLKQKAAFETERRIRKDFLEELLEKGHGDEDGTLMRAKELGMDLSKLYRVFAIELTGEEPREHQMEQQGDTINGKGSFCQALVRVLKEVSDGLVLIGKKNYFIGILSLNGSSPKNTDQYLREVMGNLEKSFNITYPNYRWFIGIGSACTGVANFNSSYHDACTTIEIIKSLKFKSKCSAYEQIAVLGLLNINIEQFRRFVDKTIGSLLEYDQKHNSNLIFTLDLYYKNNCNVEKSARTGFISSSTMKYRLRRITEIANIDLGNQETNLAIQLALKIIQGL
jgi:purine catabolism regulator